VSRILIVSTVEHPEDRLRPHVGSRDEIRVVVPVVRQGVFDWLANDERAFSHAESVAEATADALPGETVEALAGEADVDLALRDALAEFVPDEILIAVRPDDEQGFVESIATGNAPRNTFQGIPVRYLTIRD
jgi:hypothetical protein